MNPSTFYSNLSATSLSTGLNRPRFYDDLEPINTNQLSHNNEFGSYRVHNAMPITIDDDLICGSEEPQKKLKTQENRGVIVDKRKGGSNAQAQALLQEIINIDDDDVVEVKSDDDCMIMELESPKKETGPLVMKDDVSQVYMAIAKKRIEEQYRKAMTEAVHVWVTNETVYVFYGMSE